MKINIIKQIYPKKREDFRAWLEKNHIKGSKVAVIRYKKHTDKNSPSHLELMHEAICFGWIDTTIKRLDDEKYIINFSKRSDKSRWSKNTLSYAREMIRQKKMSSEGLKHYESGLKRPTLDSDAPKNPEMPNDLQSKLDMNKKALDTFKKLSPSRKRVYLRWIVRAKTLETREKRIIITIEKLLEGKNNPFY